MPFNFSKKRKKFNSHIGRYCSVPVRRSELAYSRLAKNKIAIFKSLLAKISIMAIFGGFIYLLFFSSVFKVAKIEVSGNETVGADEVRRIAENIADKKVFRFFNNNLLLIKTGEIEKAIREKFNSVDTVAAVKRFPRTLAIAIKEKPADILWCNRIKVEKISFSAKTAESALAPAVAENLPQEVSQCYFSDESNIIYRKAPNEAPDSGVKIFKDDQINIGDKISDGIIRNFVRELAKNFNSKTGLELAYLYLPPVSSRELHLITKGGWKIFFDLNRPANDQLDVLNSVWREAIPETNKKDNNIEYIDLRVAGRVPWIPKNAAVK